MKTTSALVKLVVFAVITLLATGTLAATIGNFRFGGSDHYEAVFTDVTGLTKGDDVRIAGVRVGEVSSVKVYKRTLAEVGFSVEKGRQLSRSTTALIRYRNLVGQRYISLQEGAGSSAPLKSGGTIPLSQTTPALDLTVLFNGFKPLFAALSPKDVNQFATEVIATLQGEGSSVNSLLAHTASLTSTLADRDAVIKRTIDNLNTVLRTVDVRDAQFSQLLDQLQRFVSGLAQDRTAIGDSLTNISGLAGSTASLLQEARPSIKADIAALNRVTGTLDGSSGLVDQFLHNLPTKLNRITRTATYGSWFNFYLCDFDGRIVLPTGQTYSPNFHVNTARCS